MGSVSPPILNGRGTIPGCCGTCTGAHPRTGASKVVDGSAPNTACNGNMPIRAAWRASSSNTPDGVAWWNRSPYSTRWLSSATWMPRKGSKAIRAAYTSRVVSSEPTNSMREARSALAISRDEAVSNTASYSAIGDDSKQRWGRWCTCSSWPSRAAALSR